jgi:hypothetical protein
MSNDDIQKPSSYDSLITLIDTIGPLIASLHKKTDKNSKDIEEIKFMLKRLTN